jgi:hypothetical protein
MALEQEAPRETQGVMADKQRTEAARQRHRASWLVVAGVAVTLGLLVVNGCVSAGSSIAPGPTPGTPAATATVPSPGQPTASALVVTIADNGTSLHLAIGQEFLLNLGSAADWAVTVADQRIVQRIGDVLVVRGAQGIYEARTAGTTSLSAVGSPPCPTDVCPLYRLGFRITITVG